MNTKYRFTAFREDIRNTFEYRRIEREIEAQQGISINSDVGSVKVYTPALVLFFEPQEFVVKKIGTGEVVNVKTWDYFLTYINAYKEGVQYFEENFKVSTNTLYGENAKQYVQDILVNYSQTEHLKGKRGWWYVKKESPLILSHKIIQDYGYYSGIVFKTNELIARHHLVFDSFIDTIKKKSISNEQEKFIDFLHHSNKDALLSKLHELLKGKKGKVVAKTIKALENLSFIAGYKSRASLYKAMENEFGKIGSNQALNDFLNENNNKLTEKDTEPIEIILKTIR